MKNENWWKNAVIYQVYPRSFLDTNGDGNGDLRGVIRKIPYLAKLGVNAIWLNPVQESPMVDNGYDISDYYKINPRLGTNEDMYELIETAGAAGIRVIMDIVVNHCSDQHPWFQEALKDPEGPFGRYFYFRKGKDGQPPNNWRSVFGGSVWKKVEGTDYFYLHIFAEGQPDLNWENPELRKEIFRILNFWAEKGVAGFRLDAISYIKKAEGLVSFPADDPDGMVSAYEGSLNQPGILELLHELKRETYGKGDFFTIGEVAGASGAKALPFISVKDGVFSSIFDNSCMGLDIKPPNCFWCERHEWTPDDMRESIFRSHQELTEEGWFTNVIETHDTPRAASRYLPPEGRNFFGKSLLATIYLPLRGTPIVYQGQELGMENYALSSISEYDDCQSYGNYEIALEKGFTPEEALHFVQLQSRDNTRFPMCWTDGEQGGFTTGKPWLPVSTDKARINAAAQEDDPDSLYAYYRELIGLKLHSEYSDVFSMGSFVPCYETISNLISYARKLDGRELLILCNFQNAPVSLSLKRSYRVLLDNARFIGRKDGRNEGKDFYGRVSGELCLQPYEAMILYAD